MTLTSENKGKDCSPRMESSPFFGVGNLIAAKKQATVRQNLHFNTPSFFKSPFLAAAVAANAEGKGWKHFANKGVPCPISFDIPKVSWRHISGNTSPTGFDWGNAVLLQFP